MEEVTVATSQYDIIPEGTTLTVKRDHTNQFSDKRVLTLSWGESLDVPNRRTSTEAQYYKHPEDDVWTEIHVGLSRNHEGLTFVEDL